MKTIEEKLGREDTKKLKDEQRVNFKVNKYGGEEDSKAWKMIEDLKKKNINVSKHVRMLLALEYEEKLLLPEDKAVKGYYSDSCTLGISHFEEIPEKAAEIYKEAGCLDDAMFDED